jgi:hypothetical protein
MAVIRKGLWNSPTLEDRKGGGNISGQLIEEIFPDFAFVRGSKGLSRTLETYAESPPCRHCS